MIKLVLREYPLIQILNSLSILGTFGEGEVSNNEVVVNGGEYAVCMYGTKLWIGAVFQLTKQRGIA